MRAERGFTLVEMLVAMAIGTVVLFAASAVIITSLDVTKQVTGRISALQEGRTGIETLLQQLNSGCLVNSVSPVIATTSSGISPAVASDASDLVFVSGVGDSATATPTEHVVAVKNGALLDSAYANTGGNPPALGAASTWTFSSSPYQVLNLAENVSAGSGPMFTYYAYSTSTDSLLGAPALSSPLTATTAPSVAEIDLDFRFGPSGGTLSSTQTSELHDSAVFSLTADGSGSQNEPCE